MRAASLAGQASSVLLVILCTAPFASAWSNGGYSSDPASPDYGTHDWIAEHALAWLPMSEKKYIVDNRAAFLYGTELPDNDIALDGIGDQNLHHAYYYSGGSVQDDAAAVRAGEEFDAAVAQLTSSGYQLAAKTAGIMSAYLADVAAFGHVMGSGTDWGAEVHHSDYESYVTDRTTGYASTTFDPYLVFDGDMEIVPAHAAALRIARNTTFGDGSTAKDCVWMDTNYDWSDSVFEGSAGASLNRAVNTIADVLHTLAVNAGYLALDTVAPSVIISSPTSTPAWITSSSSISLAGTATDDFGVTSVSWENAASSASGAATGLESWAATVALVAGLNEITVTAFDAAGNTGTDMFNVTNDALPPIVTITYPGNNSILGSSHVTVTGSASDNIEVKSVWISTDGWNWVQCAGTMSWSFDLVLNQGRTWIYVMALDSAGNSKVAKISVSVEIPNSPTGSSEWWPVVLVVLIVIVVGVIQIWIARRRRHL